MKTCKFEVGKTYRNGLCNNIRAVITILSRTAKTALVQWTNGYFNGTKKVKIETFKDGTKYEMITLHYTRKRKHHFFADWLSD